MKVTTSLNRYNRSRGIKMKDYKNFARYVTKTYSLGDIARALSITELDQAYCTSIYDLIEVLEITGPEVFLAFNMSREMSLLDYYGENGGWIYTLDAYRAFSKEDPIDAIVETIKTLDDEGYRNSIGDNEILEWYREYKEKKKQCNNCR